MGPRSARSRDELYTASRAAQVEHPRAFETSRQDFPSSRRRSTFARKVFDRKLVNDALFYLENGWPPEPRTS
jgi:hypothetical protein